MTPLSAAPVPARQRGLALVLVLWVLTLLSLLAASFLTETRTETLATRHRVAAAEAEALADAAVHWTMWRLVQTGQAARRGAAGGDTPEPLALDGRVRRLTLPGGAVRLAIRDEAGRIDLNMADRALLGRLLQGVGVAAPRAEAMAARILDFRDPNDAVTGSGAEDPDYERAGLPYGAKDDRFASVDELAQVLGIDPDLAQRLRPHVTVMTGSRGIDPAVATREALLAMPGVDPDQATRYLAKRAEAPPDEPPQPPPGSGFARSPQTAFTILAEARLPGGGTFVREARVRFDRIAGDRPYAIAVWRQRMQPLAAGGEGRKGGEEGQAPSQALQ